MCVCVCVFCCFSLAPDQSDTDRNLLYYLGIYAALGLAGAFMLLVKGLLLAKGSVNASTVLHEKALQAVMLAPMVT